MQTTKPYLIRAIHEWCSDSGLTPYLAVTVDAYTKVPREFVKDGQIILNVGLEATHQLMMGNDEISFQARFGGKAMAVAVPVARVSGIFARENGEGLAFEVSETLAGQDSANSATETERDDHVVEGKDNPPSPPSGQKSGRPVLTRIK
jgi:stringent starvation protein B